MSSLCLLGGRERKTTSEGTLCSALGTTSLIHGRFKSHDMLKVVLLVRIGEAVGTVRFVASGGRVGRLLCTGSSGFALVSLRLMLLAQNHLRQALCELTRKRCEALGILQHRHCLRAGA